MSITCPRAEVSRSCQLLMAEEEDDDFDDSVTRCICGNNDLQDGFMIKCDRCNVWQHGDCMDVPEENVRYSLSAFSHTCFK